MKRLFMFLLVLLGVVSLAACGGLTPTDPTVSDPTDPTGPVLEVDPNATYRTTISDTRSMNPYSETLANASTLYDMVTAGLYVGDYDWEAAIAQGVAEEVGDFTNTAQLPFNRFPGLAATRPEDVSEPGFTGTKWRITLKDGLAFEDGTVINANTYSYSWQMLADPLLLNARANNLYDNGSLPIVGVRDYFRQGKPIPDTDPVELYPAKDWADVGFKVIDDLTFEIQLAVKKTQWQVMGQLMSGITGVVHPAAYEAGMNEDRTRTSYGTIENPLVSYGAYTLETWEEDTVFIFTRNDAFYNASAYRMKNVRYDVINDQSLVIEEFRAGRLDVAGVSGQFYPEFRDNPTLRLTPVTTFFRFAINIGERPGGRVNHVLGYPEFRKALYHAIDRETFSTEVRAPSFPVQSFIGPVYLASEYNAVSYRASQAGMDLLADLFPATYGYNPNLAKQLFDQAYAQAVAEEKIASNEIVEVEYVFFDVETNWIVANWVKDTVEEIFNDAGVNRPKFVLKLTALSSDALNSAWDSHDFDLTFGGWQGMQFDPAGIMGYVYNSAEPWKTAYMLENGFDTANAPISVKLPGLKAAAEVFVADLQAITDRDLSELEEDYLEGFIDFLDKVNEDGSYDTTFDLAWNDLRYFLLEYDLEYAGRPEDMNNLTAAMEGVLLDQMIAIPLFNNTGVAVYSNRVVFEAQDYHVWMGWGGLRYMFIAKV